MWIYYVILVYYNKFSQTWIEEAFILLAMQWLSSDSSAASGILCPPVKVSLNRTVNPTLCSLWQRDTCKCKTFPQSKPTRAPQTLVRSTWLIQTELKKAGPAPTKLPWKAHATVLWRGGQGFISHAAALWLLSGHVSAGSTLWHDGQLL